MSENKYQEALDRRKEEFENMFNVLEIEKNNVFYEDIEILQELVDKATPKKPKGISVTFDGRVANCPCCNTFVREQNQKRNICKCGQIIDWEENKDE